jgi:hypothetical protein
MLLWVNSSRTSLISHFSSKWLSEDVPFKSCKQQKSKW